MPGWSNFCTLVGHFSKLFEFADRNRLKTPIFIPKSGCSLKKKKKKVFTWNRSLKLLIQTVKNYIYSRKKLNEKLEPNVSYKTFKNWVVFLIDTHEVHLAEPLNCSDGTPVENHWSTVMAIEK